MGDTDVDVTQLNDSAAQPQPMPQSAPTAPAQTTPPAKPNQGYEPHSIWGSIFKALGGGDRTAYHVAGPGETDPSTGKPVPEGTTVSSRVAPTKGELGKAILASVIYGLAAGEKQRGPGAGLRSLSAGGEAALNTGLAQDERARQQAQTDFQNKQQAQLKAAQIFSANAEAVHNIREAEKLQEETFQGMIDRDSSALADVDPSDIVAKDVPQDQVLTDLKAGKYGATSHNVYASGSTEVRDKGGNVVNDPTTGQPKREVTLTITNDKPVSLTQADAQRYAQYGIPGFSGLNPSGDTTVPASQKRGWDQMVHSAENARGLAKKMGVSDEDFNKALQEPGAAKASQQFSRYSTGDPYADLQRMESAKDKDTGNPTYGPRTMGLLREAFGGDQAKLYHDKLEAQAVADKKTAEVAAENAQQAKDSLTKLENDASQMQGEKASSVVAMLNSKIKTETDPVQKARETRLLAQATAAHKAYLGDKASEAYAEQAARQGDPAAGGKLLASGDLTLADLKTRGVTPDYLTKAIAAAKKINPSYNPADEMIAEQVAKSTGANQFFGSANSLISKGGTLDQLKAQGDKLPDHAFPFFNSVAEYVDYATGHPEMAGYINTAIGVADDYAKVMGGGVGSDTSRLQVLQSLSAAQNSTQRQAALDAARNAVTSQVESRIGKNQFLRRQYGYNLPYQTKTQPQQNSNDPFAQFGGKIRPGQGNANTAQ